MPGDVRWPMSMIDSSMALRLPFSDLRLSMAYAAAL